MSASQPAVVTLDYVAFVKDGKSPRLDLGTIKLPEVAYDDLVQLTDAGGGKAVYKVVDTATSSGRKGTIRSVTLATIIPAGVDVKKGVIEPAVAAA